MPKTRFKQEVQAFEICISYVKIVICIVGSFCILYFKMHLFYSVHHTHAPIQTSLKLYWASLYRYLYQLNKQIHQVLKWKGSSGGIGYCTKVNCTFQEFWKIKGYVSAMSLSSASKCFVWRSRQDWNSSTALTNCSWKKKKQRLAYLKSTLTRPFASKPSQGFYNENI